MSSSKLANTIRLSIMLPASRQINLLRRHLLTPTLCRRRRQNSTAAQCDSPPSPSPEGESLLNQALKLVQSPENDWNSDQLRNLLFSNEFSLPHVLEITLSLGSSSRALNFLEYVKSNAPSEQNRYPSFVFYGVLKLLIREPISKTTVLELYNIVKERRVPLTTDSATLLIQILQKAEMTDELFLLFNDLEPSLKSTGVFNTFVMGLLRLGRTDDALKVLDEMLKPNAESPPNDVTGDIVFTEFLKTKSSGRSITEEEIGGLVRNLSKCRVFPDTYKLTQMIDKLCKKGKTNLAWDLLHHLMRLGVAVSAAPCNSLLTGLRKDGDKKRMNDLLDEMKELQIQPNFVTFKILISHLCKSRRIDDALLVLEKMRGNGESSGMKVEPDGAIFNTLIVGLCKVGRQEEGLRLLEDIKNHNEHGPNTITYTCLIGAFCKAGNLDKAHEIFDEMNKEGVQPDVVTFNTLIDGFCKAGNLDKAHEICDEMNKEGVQPDVVTFNTLIDGFGKAGNLDKAHEMFDEMNKEGVQPNVVTFNTLIGGFCKAGNLDKAHELFDVMNKEGVLPNVVTFNTLIGDFCKAGNLDKAYELFDVMNKEGVLPDVVTFNTLIGGFCKTGNLDKAHELFDVMNKEGVLPNVVTFNTLIGGFCKAGNLDKAYELFDVMNKEGVLPDVVTFNTLIGGFCKAGNLDKAHELFDVMNKEGVLPDVVTFNTLIAGFCKAGNLDKAHELFDVMNKEGVQPDVVTINALLDGMCKHGRIGSAIDFFNEMQKKGIKGDVVTYSVLISAYCSVNKLEKVEEMLSEMEQIVVKPDAVTYNTLISFFAKAGDFETAGNIISKMIEEGLETCVVTYGAVIHGYCLHGKVDEAMKIFREMNSPKKVLPDSIIYSILIEALCKNDEVESAVSLLDDMKVKGIKPNTNTYNAIFKGLQNKRMTDKAFEYMDRMVEDACKPDHVTMEILTEWLVAVGEMEKLKIFGRAYNEKQ